MKESCFETLSKTLLIFKIVLSQITKQSWKLIEIDENKKEYKQRNKVEAHNGTYKTYYHITEMPLVGIENIQAIINEMGASYNIKRLFNIFKEENIDLNDVYKVMDILTAPNSDFLCNGGLFAQKWTIFKIRIVYAKPHIIKDFIIKDRIIINLKIK